MPLVVDIETAGQELPEIPERAQEHLFRQLEREQLSGEELEARRQEIVDRLGLDPTTGRIICIGMLETETGAETVLADRGEADLLRSFWDFLREREPALYVTFNGKRFDFPFINIRSAILRIAPTRFLPLPPRSPAPHFDVREVLAGEDPRRRGGLDYFCAVFGLPSPKELLDGSRVGEAYRQGRLEEIARYCLADCRATASLYERLQPFYLPENP